MTSYPVLIRTESAAGEPRYVLGHPLVDRYLEFVAGRVRPNTLRAVAFDLKAFFSALEKEPTEVATADVFEFLTHQRGDRKVVRMSDGEFGLSARTIARRLSSVSGFYAYLVVRDDTALRLNPVPRGLSTRRRRRRARSSPACCSWSSSRSAPASSSSRPATCACATRRHLRTQHPSLL